MRLRPWSRAAWGVIVMVSLSLFPRLLAARELDVTDLVGEDWYGLYLNGQKAGYSVSGVAVEDDGTVVVTEDAQFMITMVGVRQDMRIESKRTYAPDGALRTIENRIVDPAGVKTFHAVVEGEEMVLKTIVRGKTTETRLPKPNESLQDALQQVALVGEDAQVGDEVTFSVFEPMGPKEITGTSRITGVEERLFDGAMTQVFEVTSTMPELGLTSLAWVAQDGTVLEDVVAGIITMRLEPEALAKDVDYSNDVIVSNAAAIRGAIADPHGRATLTLRLEGPLTEDHLFNDDRQTIEADGDGFLFTGRRVALEGFTAAQLPIEDEAVAEWLKPTVLVQSDAPHLAEKARSIVGDATDALEVSNRLCAWVHANVRTAYSAQLTNALEVLERLEGDCTEYSVLFIGLARAAGLPAREVAGLIYMAGAPPGFYFHQWAKVWVGRWIDVDPTFNQPFADATHIKLAEGDLFEQARLIPIIGRIQVEVLDADGGE